MGTVRRIAQHSLEQSGIPLRPKLGTGQEGWGWQQEEDLLSHGAQSPAGCAHRWQHPKSGAPREGVREGGGYVRMSVCVCMCDIDLGHEVSRKFVLIIYFKV